VRRALSRTAARSVFTKGPNFVTFDGASRFPLLPRAFSTTNDDGGDRDVIEASIGLAERAKGWRVMMRQVRKEDPGDIDDIIETKIAEVREMLRAGTPPPVVEAHLETFESEMRNKPGMSLAGGILWVFLGGLAVYSTIMVKGIIDEKKGKSQRK